MKFKKFLTVALGLVMGLPLAAGCAPSEEEGGGDQGGSTEDIVFSRKTLPRVKRIRST